MQGDNWSIEGSRLRISLESPSHFNDGPIRPTNEEILPYASRLASCINSIFAVRVILRILRGNFANLIGCPL